MPLIIRNGRVYGGSPKIDKELSVTSKNPVENQAIAKAIEDIKENETPHWIGTRAELEAALEAEEIEEGTVILITDEPDVDELPTENSTKLVYSGGVWTALQEKEDLFRYETMPVADEDFDGIIVQFVGVTTTSYTNGYFYECVGETEGGVTTYSWVQKNVQPDGDIILDVATLPVSDVEDAIYRTTDAVSGDVDYFFGNSTDDSTLEILTEDERIQFDTMPTASADYLGRVIEYVGTTTVTATNGFFYECVEVEDSDPVEYEWVQKNVQPETIDYVGDKATFDNMTAAEKAVYNVIYFTDI